MEVPHDTENVNGNDVINEDHQMSTDEIIESNEMNTVLPGNDSEQSWFQPVQDPWSLPFSATGLNVSYPTALDVGGPPQWTNGRSTPSTAPEETSFLSPAFREGSHRNEYSPGRQAPHEVYHVDRVASSQASQASQASQTPASSSTSPQEDHVVDLYSCLDKASPVTKRLLQVYFSEIHPYWPILHAPTFDTCGASASRVLLGSMIMLASWVEGGHDHTKFAPLVFDALIATILVCSLEGIPCEPLA